MEITEIEKRINYSFNDKLLLVTAFTHSSYANENNITSNEMLEFLGDSVLSLTVSEFLFNNAHSSWQEKDLSEKRAQIVSKTPLAKAVDRLKIMDYLRCGVGESRSNPVKPESMRGDLFEAVTGAIFIDGGIEKAKTFVFKVLGNTMTEVTKAKTTENFVGKLLEHTLKSKKQIFKYTEIKDGEKTEFLAEAVIDGKVLGSAQAASKTYAEKIAAREACGNLGLI